MKNYGLLFLSFILAGSLYAQDFDMISVDEGYSQQAFYELETGNTMQSDLTAWDIAFNTNPQSGGVIMNEGSSSTTTNPKPELKVFVTNSTEFNNTDTTGMERIYNNELSWDAGAFNHVKNDSNALDYGWGTYNFNSHRIIGNQVYAIQLRDGTFKKFMVDSLAAGTFYFTYADLDGSDEQSYSINKSDYPDKTLAFFSFSENSTVNVAPQKWNMIFTRYTTKLVQSGTVYQYMVTGVLSGPGVQVAQADDVNPAEVEYDDHKSNLSDSLKIIGHDWKQYDFGSGSYVVVDNRVYFVKTSNNSVWKLRFVDFEGSSTGVTTIEKQLVSETTSTVESSDNVSEFTIFPNPASDIINFSVDVKSGNQKADIQIYSVTGEEVYSVPIQLYGGFNVKRINLNLPSGMYYFNLQLKDEMINRKLQIQ